jgi:hypothetical protein
MLSLIRDTMHEWFQQGFELNEEEIKDLINSKLRSVIYQAYSNGGKPVEEVKNYCLDNGVNYTSLLHEHVLIVMNEYLSQLN